MNHPDHTGRVAISAIAALTTAFLFAPTVPDEGFASERQEPAMANELMVRAHQARAVWENFPGFDADVVVSSDGQRLEGHVTVTADGTVTLDLPESNSAAWVEREIRSLVMHRRAGEDPHYDVSFADQDTEHPLGRLIKFNDDRMHSVYRINGDVITEVHRQMGDSKFSISVFEVTRNAEGKSLPKTYAVSFWDAETGNLKSSSTSYNEWTRVGHLDLPVRLLSVGTGDDGHRDVRQIVFTNHALIKLAE